MIVAAVGPDATFYRVLTPRWSHLPTSGAGAALGGGRFNRPGVEALYLSLEVDTAIAEYRQDSSLLRPGTFASFAVTLDAVVDFRAGFAAGTWPDGWSSWDCDWKQIARIERREPPSWRIADEVVRSGRKGLLYPSIRRPGGTNIVVYPANYGAGDSVAVVDPEGALPTDPSSWPT